MHDLNTIIRLNNQAVDNAVPKLQQAGNFVLVKYAGLSVLSIETFSPERVTEACAALTVLRDTCGASERAVLHPPVAQASSEQTLGQYIERKTRPLATEIATQAC